MWSQLRIRTTLILAALLLVVTLGCSAFEGTPPPNQDMVGDWTAADGSATLSISSSGHVNYFRRRGGSTTELNMPANAWTDTGFSVGALGMSTDFSIDTPPEQVDGVWHVTIDELEYVRGGN